MSYDEKRLDRRSVLKTVGSATAAGVGLGAASSSGAAAETKDELARAYSDERRLRVAFQQHGDGLRQTLVAEGFVSEDFEFGELDFDVDPEATGLAPTAEDGRAGVTGVTEDGTTTAFASVSTSNRTHELALFVQPERDEAYALVEPRDGDDRFRVTASGVSPQGCIRWECGNACCDIAGGVRYVYSCDDNCENCTLYNTDCECFC